MCLVVFRCCSVSVVFILSAPMKYCETRMLASFAQVQLFISNIPNTDLYNNPSRFIKFLCNRLDVSSYLININSIYSDFYFLYLFFF